MPRLVDEIDNARPDLRVPNPHLFVASTRNELEEIDIPEAQRKTIQRLMRLQPHVQKGLRKLANQRRLKDNRTYIRAGNEWVARVKTTKLTWVKPGETFTIFVTPQVVPDLQSVAEFLKTS